MPIISLFSKEYYPQFRAYTLLIAGLIAGGSVAVNLFSSDDSSSGNQQEELWSHSTEIFWEKSPVNVKKGDVIIIYATGKYYLDIDSLLNNPAQREHFASGSNGIEKAKLPKDNRKKLIYPRANYGQLLLQINSSNTKPKLKPKNPIVLAEGKNEIEVEQSGTLWFSTNQPVFYPYKNEDWQRYTSFTGLTINSEEFQETKPEPFFTNNFGQLTLMIKAE